MNSFFFELYQFISFPIFEGIEDLSRGDYLMGSLSVLVGILMIAMLLLIVFMVLYVVYEIVDTSGRQFVARGKIVNTHYIAAHTTITTVNTGKTTTVIPIYHPDRWTVTAECNNSIDTLDVSKKLYQAVRIGSVANFRVTTGKLSKRTRILGFEQYTSDEVFA